MKRRDFFVAFLLVVAIIGIVYINFNNPFTYGMSMQISGQAGNRVLKYYDENNKEITIEQAIKNYGVTRYQEMPSGSGSIYFYNGKEISESKYKTGYAGELADNRAKQYGNAGIRVSTTENFKKAFDNLFQNYLSGTFSFNWSPYDNIDFDAVEKYVMTKYGVLDPYQNFYTYEVKGTQEPLRFALNLKSYKNTGEFIFENYRIRHTGDEKKKVDFFLDKLFKTEMPPASASDYEKIKASFVYITTHSRYYVDDGFINDYISGFTSMYDNLLGEHPNNKEYGATNCIGYAVTFAYFMQRYGIETYIVDGATTVDTVNKKYTSDHTYNLVKLDGKWYRCDLTFGNGYFLIPMSTGVLYKSNLNLATTKYTNETPTYTFNENNIKNYKTQAKNLSVTTTTKRALTTNTVKTSNVKQTSTNYTNPKTSMITTTTTAYSTTTTTETSYIPSTTTTTTETTTTTVNASIKPPVTTKAPEPEEKNDNTVFNVIMISLFLIILIAYIIYKVMNGKKKNVSLDTLPQANIPEETNQQVNNQGFTPIILPMTDDNTYQQQNLNNNPFNSANTQVPPMMDNTMNQIPQTMESTTVRRVNNNPVPPIIPGTNDQNNNQVIQPTDNNNQGNNF